MFRFAGLGLTLLGSALFPSWPVQAASFDGPWSLEVTTERGGCDQLYRYYVVVENGQVRVRTMSGQLGGPAGSIAESGRVNSRIGSAQDPVEIVGRLSRNTGGGSWTAPARGCSGSWTAARR